MHVFTSFVLFEGEKFHGGGRVWYFNVIWLKSIHTFTFFVTVFTASASIRVSARNASLYIAVMIFCAQPYLKPCFMCPFYILSTCPSKGLCTALAHTNTLLSWMSVLHHLGIKHAVDASSPASAFTYNVSGYVCNHGSPSGERDTASPRGHYGERLQRDSCLKKHMKKHHPLAGDSPWRHYRRDHNIRTAGWIHHSLLRLKLASEAWPQSLGDAVSRSPLGEPWLHT